VIAVPNTGTVITLTYIGRLWRRASSATS